jgi:hypothetical protein
MADLLYNSALEDEANGVINYDTGTFKLLLVTEDYAPDIDAHTTLSDITDEVASGSGYTTGGEEVAVTVTKSTANDRVTIEFAAASWPSASFTARRGIYYQLDSGTPANSPLIGVNDFGANITATGGTFSIAASTRTKQNNSTGA